VEEFNPDFFVPFCIYQKIGFLRLQEVQANICFVHRKQCFNNKDVTVTEKMFVVDRVERKRSKD
jgi:hypothetical protein